MTLHKWATSRSPRVISSTQVPGAFFRARRHIIFEHQISLIRSDPLKRRFIGGYGDLLWSEEAFGRTILRRMQTDCPIPTVHSSMFCRAIPSRGLLWSSLNLDPVTSNCTALDYSISNGEHAKNVSLISQSPTADHPVSRLSLEVLRLSQKPLEVLIVPP